MNVSNAAVLSIPNQFDETALTTELKLRLAGPRADGNSSALPDGLTSVVWVDDGHEVLVHLDSVAVRIVNRTLLVSVDLEADQTGRSPLIVALALAGDTSDPAGLVATTDEYPRGNGLLAARWGRILQNAIWACLLSIAQDHATERAGMPNSLVLAKGLLQISSAPPLRIDPKILPILGGIR